MRQNLISVLTVIAPLTWLAARLISTSSSGTYTIAYGEAASSAEELIPAHAVRLHESPTCQLTGAPFVEDAASPYAMVYVPEEDVLISRAANQVKGVMTVNMLIKFCRIVAKANPLTA